MNGEIRLINIDDHSLIYKIRSTNPSKYQVRPSQGILKTNEYIKIDIQRKFLVVIFFYLDKKSKKIFYKMKDSKSKQLESLN